MIAGSFGVPADAGAVALNVTVVSPTAGGFATVWPSGDDKPWASNLNYVTGDVVPNMVTVKLGADGAVELYHERRLSQMIIDVAGWYRSPPHETIGIVGSFRVGTQSTVAWPDGLEVIDQLVGLPGGLALDATGGTFTLAPHVDFPLGTLELAASGQIVRKCGVRSTDHSRDRRRGDAADCGGRPGASIAEPRPGGGGSR